MKVVNSAGSKKRRHKHIQMVRRRGRVFLICKANRRFNCRLG